MKTTRRNAVKFIAGSAVGAVFTPAPWHLIRDSALWSENWPGIPRPARGEVTSKVTRCALCPGGCPVRARCVGGQPVSLAGVEGGLCPLGVTGHHLPYHPRRLGRGPVAEARKAADAALARGARPAVLDLRPRRPESALYRRAMANRGGYYLAPPAPAVGIDLKAARTVISLGVPLLEGWLPPARVFAARDGFRLVQIEPALSRTAALADEWLPRCDDAAALARARQSEGQVLVIDPAMSAAVVALNRELGGWEKTMLPLGDEPAMNVAAAPDGSIGLLYIDESGPGAYLPWPEIERKLAPDAVVVALAWWQDGYARHTQFALPTAVWPEPELIKPLEGVVDPVEFITGHVVGQAVPPANPALPGGTAWPTITTPLFSKVYQESGLLLAPSQVAVDPASGFAAGDRAYLVASRGRIPVTVVVDAGLPPGDIRFQPTPAVLDLCGGETPKVVRA